MATWETSVASAVYSMGNRVPVDAQIGKITDNKVGDTTFEFGEPITIFIGGTPALGTFVFRGTITHEGKEYPVVGDAAGDVQYVIGIASTSLPQKIAPAINAPSLNISKFTVCFFPGTLIATPSGERKVDELVSDDLVLVGDMRVAPVKWIGRQTISTIFGPAERFMPVRFDAGSLGGQPIVPHSDLTVTADHAMLVDGILCEAGALVNGTTITRVPLPEFGDNYTVYHVETEAHEIILANGAPAETFVDNDTRRAFDNFFEFEALHGDPPEMKELPYPRASNARHLPARIKARLGLDLQAHRPRRSAS